MKYINCLVGIYALSTFISVDAFGAASVRTVSNNSNDGVQIGAPARSGTLRGGSIRTYNATNYNAAKSNPTSLSTSAGRMAILPQGTGLPNKINLNKETGVYANIDNLESRINELQSAVSQNQAATNQSAARIDEIYTKEEVQTLIESMLPETSVPIAEKFTKINDIWFNCSTWATTNRDTQSIENEVRNNQCNESLGYNYGANCFFYGEIERYDYTPYSIKYTVCKAIDRDFIASMQSGSSDTTTGSATLNTNTGNLDLLDDAGNSVSIELPTYMADTWSKYGGLFEISSYRFIRDMDTSSANSITKLNNETAQICANGRNDFSDVLNDVTPGDETEKIWLPTPIGCERIKSIDTPNRNMISGFYIAKCYDGYYATTPTVITKDDDGNLVGKQTFVTFNNDPANYIRVALCPKYYENANSSTSFRCNATVVQQKASIVNSDTCKYSEVELVYELPTTNSGLSTNDDNDDDNDDDNART